MQPTTELLKELEPLLLQLARKYKSFVNYEDLLQDGRLAICNALLSYNENKGTKEMWCYYYIKTTIQRSAAKHSVMHIPMKKITDKFKPYKDDLDINTIDNGKYSPEDKYLHAELENKISLLVKKLPKEWKAISQHHYFGEESINEFCRQQKITIGEYHSRRYKIIKTINNDI